jgi:23S rRNA pseudouridine1911/1915/1917 synthase
MINKIQLELREFVAGYTDIGQRLDVFLSTHCLDLSRARVQSLIDKGNVVLGRQLAKRSYKMQFGDEVTLRVPPPEIPLAIPQNLPISVVYEDKDLLVVDKPAGMTVHPSPGHSLGTLVNALLAYCPDLTGVGDELRPGIVHRLDKETSGLLVVAKNDRSYQSLQAQFKARSVYKIYQALVWGHPEPFFGTIEGPIARHHHHRKRMAIVSGGKSATTNYRTLNNYHEMSLLEVIPKTGRTHQIRVHLASIGHAIVGDRLYGRAKSELGRHFLHAATLGFFLPSSEEYAEFLSPLPVELRLFIDGLSG